MAFRSHAKRVWLDLYAYPIKHSNVPQHSKKESSTICGEDEPKCLSSFKFRGYVTGLLGITKVVSVIDSWHQWAGSCTLANIPTPEGEHRRHVAQWVRMPYLWSKGPWFKPQSQQTSSLGSRARPIIPLYSRHCLILLSIARHFA